MTLCTVASRHICNVVMIEVISCAAKPFPVLHSHMLWHQWVYRVLLVHGRKQVQGFHPSYPSRTNTNPVEAAFAGMLLSWCLQHNGSKDMHKQVLTCWWQSHYPNWFPFYTCIVGVNPQPWMLTNTHTKDCIASIRSAWVAPIPPNTMLKSWTEILQKSVQSWYIPFALQVCYDIRASFCMQIWCTGSFSLFTSWMLPFILILYTQ